MTSIRRRTTFAALTLLAAGLSACANDPMSPIESTRNKVSADVDSTKRAPTIPWADVSSAAPTIPWH